MTLSPCSRIRSPVLVTATISNVCDSPPWICSKCSICEKGIRSLLMPSLLEDTMSKDCDSGNRLYRLMTWEDAKCSVPNIAKRLTIKIPMTSPSGNLRAGGLVRS